jgi:tetratricopeptide (TPR) repeat protein
MLPSRPGSVFMSDSSSIPPQLRERLREIQAVARAGDLPRAAELATAALNEGLLHPFLFNVTAAQLDAVGRLEESEALLRRALSLDRDDAGTLQSLGVCLLRLERPEEARPLFERVLDLHPELAPAHVALGQALEAGGDLRRAESHYRRALELAPHNLLAESGLASIGSRRGDHAQAHELASRVLAREPNYPPAAIVAGEAEVALGKLDAAEKRMRELAADSRATAVERALALGVVADALDRGGRTAEAFATYVESNAMRRAHYAPAFSGAQNTLAYTRGLIQWLAQNPAEDLITVVPPEPSVSPASGHAFLLGFPRSGTTLLEQVLAGHPQVVALEERETLIDSVRAYMRQPSDLAKLGLASEADLEPMRRAYWSRVGDAGVHVNKRVFVDKHPFNGLKLPIITRLFPEGRILLAIRDPRDVVWSCFRRRFRMSAPYFELLSLDGAAELYDAVMELTTKFISALQLRVHVVKLEAFVDDFDNQLRSLCDFLQLTPVAGMRDFAATARARGVATASGAQMARGLSKSGFGEWRRYADELAPVLPRLERWVKHYGYEN